MTPKILFLTHVGEPGGAEFVMMRLCESVKEQCSVVYFEQGILKRYLNDLGVRSSVLPMPAAMSGVRRQGGIGGVIRAVPAVLSMVQELGRKMRGADLVVCMSQKSFFLVALARVFVRRPIVWFMNDLVSPSHFSKPLIFLMVKVFAGFAAVHDIKLSTGALGILKCEGGVWRVEGWNVRPPSFAKATADRQNGHE